MGVVYRGGAAASGRPQKAVGERPEPEGGAVERQGEIDSQSKSGFCAERLAKVRGSSRCQSEALATQAPREAVLPRRQAAAIARYARVSAAPQWKLPRIVRSQSLTLRAEEVNVVRVCPSGSLRRSVPPSSAPMRIAAIEPCGPQVAAQPEFGVVARSVPAAVAAGSIKHRAQTDTKEGERRRLWNRDITNLKSIELDARIAGAADGIWRQRNRLGSG